MLDQRSMRSALAVLFTVLSPSTVFIACTDAATVPAQQRAPSALQVVAGDHQEVHGAALGAHRLEVRVVDAQSKPLAGVSVAWQSDNALVIPQSTKSITDQQGIATTEVSVGALYNKIVVVTATVPGVPAASFSLTINTAPVTSIVLAALPTLLVGTNTSVSFSVRAADGTFIPVSATSVNWSTTNPAVARISAGGVVTAITVGTTDVIASYGGIFSRISVSTAALLRVTLGFQWDFPELSVGDSIQLKAYYTDNSGNDLPGIPNVTWSTTSPQQMRVTQSGWVFADADLGGSRSVGVVVTERQATASMTLHITPRVSGNAIFRYVHAVSDRGPLTLNTNRGESVSMSFEQVIERTYPSGLLTVSMPGVVLERNAYFSTYAGMLAPDNPRTVFAIGTTEYTWLIGVSDQHDPIPSDKVLARVVLAQGYIGGGYTYNVYLVAPGAPLLGNAQFCYFEFGATEYMLRAAGDFDIVIISPAANPTYDNPGVELARVRAHTQAGKAQTFVVTGHSQETVKLMTLLDR